MTTPVTTTELFTLTGVLSCANAGWVARMTKTAVNTANREMVLFITASPDAKAFPAHLYSPTWGGPLSVISDHVSVISDHRQRIRESRPCQRLSFRGRFFLPRGGKVWFLRHFCILRQQRQLQEPRLPGTMAGAAPADNQ